MSSETRGFGNSRRRPQTSVRGSSRGGREPREVIGPSEWLRTVGTPRSTLFLGARSDPVLRIGSSVSGELRVQPDAMGTQFVRLNDDWNAEPNAPHPAVAVERDQVVLTFLANAFEHARFSEGQRLRLRFTNTRRYRLGPTNDHGWFAGQCRFSGEAPEWGQFYEVSGDRKLELCPDDWQVVDSSQAPTRHFLFYLRDETFECEADDWALEE